jgi:hypothetical protein
VLGIDMAIDGNVKQVERTLEDAKQYCLVLNSLRVPVVVETEIRTPNHATEAVAFEQPYAGSTYDGPLMQVG